MSGFRVEVRNVDGAVTALASAGPHTAVIDRPVEAGGGGKGWNGGQLLHLAVAACVSNDLFREARARNIELVRVVVIGDGAFAGDPAVSTGINYEVEVEGQATQTELDELIRHVDAIAEIPNSLRHGTQVRMTRARAVPRQTVTATRA